MKTYTLSEAQMQAVIGALQQSASYLNQIPRDSACTLDAWQFAAQNNQSLHVLRSIPPSDDGALVEILENLIARLKVISGQGDENMHTVRALAWDAISMINVFLDAHAKQKGGG